MPAHSRRLTVNYLFNKSVLSFLKMYLVVQSLNVSKQAFLPTPTPVSKCNLGLWRGSLLKRFSNKLCRDGRWNQILPGDQYNTTSTHLMQLAELQARQTILWHIYNHSLILWDENGIKMRRPNKADSDRVGWRLSITYYILHFAFISGRHWRDMCYSLSNNLGFRRNGELWKLRTIINPEVFWYL